MLIFLDPYIIQCACSVGLMFGMMIDIGSKFYSVPPPPTRVAYRSRSQTLIFVVLCSIFKILQHLNLLFSLVNMSNTLFYTIFSYLEVKVTDLNNLSCGFS